MSAIDQSRLELLKDFGSHTIAFHTLQPGLDYYDLPNCGFIAYKDYLGHRFALGDPVCAPERYGEIIERFDKDSEKPITFFHINECTGAALNRAGYYINEMGEEMTINIQTYDYRGQRKVGLRNLHNNVIKRGVEVREVYGDEELYKQAERISSLWLTQVKKKSKEIWYITRRPIFQDIPQIRRFYGFLDGVPVAFVYFDPVWRNGEVRGYYAALLKRTPGSPNGVQDYIIRVAMEKFREEGVKTLHLGLLPAHNIEDDIHRRFNYSWFTMKMFQWTYESAIANYFYAFKSLSFHKERYRAPLEKAYMATRSVFPIPGLMISGRMCGVY